ncbi:MAG: hypothetical protein ACSLFP_05815, partial [Acidimicrobiales bacterium]
PPMLRRPLALLLALVVTVLLTAAPATAQDTDGDADEERLPGTTLEANQRDEGGASLVPWVVGSGVAAIVLIVGGGLVVQRRTR